MRDEALAARRSGAGAVDAIAMTITAAGRELTRASGRDDSANRSPPHSPARPGPRNGGTVAASAAALSGRPAFSVSSPAAVTIQVPPTTSSAGISASHEPT